MAISNWGEAGDIPLPAEYTGEGIADLAFWRPSNATWYIKVQEPRKTWVGGICSVPAGRKLGQAGDIPVPGDYTGSGKVEPAVQAFHGFNCLLVGDNLNSLQKGAIINLPYRIKSNLLKDRQACKLKLARIYKLVRINTWPDAYRRCTATQYRKQYKLSTCTK
ncbi:hypothetical protein [Desertivirga xinjiangensis]|uniref:hypothetical protein n=1 Tax=Desertivirga xinjiangensis TaxID=539206 RepID=UPI0021096DA2|nr:hypothetical protein [Pedobacter xinjiangensis]